MRIGLAVGATGAVAVFGLACGSDDLLLPSDGRPAALAVVSGNNQSAQVSAELPDAVVVRVTDATGRPVAGARVTFQVTSPSGGGLSPAQAVTDAGGEASAEWSLGATAGAQTAEARVEAPAVAPLALTAFAAAGVATRLELVSGDGQTAPVGTMLPDSLSVRATDAEGNPVEGFGVTWSSPDGGSVSAEAVATGANGRAGIRRTLGPAAGTQTTFATASGVAGSPVAFRATATTGAAGKLTVVAQPSATAANAQPFAEQPRVQVVDQFNNPVATGGVAVTVGIDGDPANVELRGQRTVATDAGGLATYSGLSLVGPPGTYALRFTGVSLAGVVSGGIALRPGPVSDDQSSVSASPSSIVVIAGRATLTVTVRDEFGFPISGTTVVPSANRGGATFEPANGPTNSAGVATFAFGASAPGEYRLSASAGGTELDEDAAVTVTKATTTITIGSHEPNPSAFFEQVTVTFAVTSSVGGPLTGLVTVREVGGSGTCTAPATAGQCALEFGQLGPRQIEATYAGDDAHEPSTSAQVTHTVVLFR